MEAGSGGGDGFVVVFVAGGATSPDRPGRVVTS